VFGNWFRHKFFVSRRADFGDHDHRPKTLRISAQLFSTNRPSEVTELGAQLIDFRTPMAPRRCGIMDDAVSSFIQAVLKAQAHNRIGFSTALREIKAGQKRSHWIWYVWPCLKGVRKTSQPQFELLSLEYASAWLRHETLGPRLLEITLEAVIHLEAGVKPERLFGSDVDAFKFHNCVQLFLAAATQAVPENTEAKALFHRSLQALGRDQAKPTLELLSKAAGPRYRIAHNLEDHGFRRSRAL
jgi:uncharacterized protein (DUF1810 family)